MDEQSHGVDAPSAHLPVAARPRAEPEGSGCTCWLFRAPDGAAHPAARFHLHDRVTVRTVNGWTAEGTTGWGFTGPADARRPVLTVRTDDGSVAWCPPEDVSCIAPVALQSEIGVVAATVDALARPHSIPADGLLLSTIVDDHHRVEVHVHLARVECQPSTSGAHRPAGPGGGH